MTNVKHISYTGCPVCNVGEVVSNYASKESYQLECDNRKCGSIWYPVVLDVNEMYGDTQYILKQTNKAHRAIKKYQKIL